MNAKFLGLVLVVFFAVSFPKSVIAADQEEVTQAGLESDFQSEDHKNLTADLQLAKRDAKENEMELKGAQRKAETLRAQNEKLTQEIQGQNNRITIAKQGLQDEQGKIEKLQIDLVNNKKEAERLRSENAELALKRAQAREEEAKLKKDLARLQSRAKHIKTPKNKKVASRSRKTNHGKNS